LRIVIAKRVLLERVMTLTELGCCSAWCGMLVSLRSAACFSLPSSAIMPGRPDNNYARSRDFLHIEPVRASLYISQPCV